MTGLLLLCLFSLSSELHAAVVLAQYKGGGDPVAYSSSFLKWRGDSVDNSNVVPSSVTEDGRAAYLLLDPGLERGANVNSLYYNVRLSTAQVLGVKESGWDLTMSMKVPGLDDVPGPAWNRDGNISLGYYYVEPSMTGYRTSFLLTAGRDAQGNTLIQLAGGSGTLTLTPEFHTYTMSYRDGLVTLYVDGEARLTTTGSTTESTSTVNMMYWGDNNNAPAATTYGQRLVYFESVELVQVPEPRVWWLLLVGAYAIGFKRRRILRVESSTPRLNASR